MLMPIGGRLAEKIGANAPVMIGLVQVAITNLYLSQISPNSSEITLMFFLFISGLGTGISLLPNSVVGLNSLPAPLIAAGAALQSLPRQIAAATAVAVLIAIVSSHLGGAIRFNGKEGLRRAQDAYNAAFRVGFGAVVVTIGVAAFLPGRTRAKPLQTEQIAEQKAGLATSIADVFGGE